MYKEYLAEFWYSAKALENSKVSFSVPNGGIYGEVGINTFRNAIGAHYLPHSSEYVAPSSIDIVRPWFETIGYGEIVPAKRDSQKDLANGINIDYASIFWEDIIIKLNKRHREKVVPYTRSLSLLMMHRLKEGYRDGEVTPYPTQVFSVNNWALKPNQPEEPPFTDHMLAICTAAKPVVFKAHKPSSNAERVPQGIKPRAKPGHKKHSTSLKQPFVSSSEATKGESSKRPTGSKTGHLKRKKESSSAMDSNPSQTSASTPVVAKMHKEDQQATGGPTSLGVTSEARSNPQLSSGNDASTVSTAEVDPEKSAPSDFIPQQQGMNEGTKNTSYDHLFAGASSIARQVEEDEASRTIKLEDLTKLVSSVQPSFKDLDSPKDNPIIVVDDSDEDEEAGEVHATIKAKIEDSSVLISSSPRAQPFFLNMGQLNELLVKSLQTELSKILSAHDFSSSLPIELKELPSKCNELAKEVKCNTPKLDRSGIWVGGGTS
ncbi:hypothetical protein Tco_1524576 [Tanacetum coccineum]